MNDQRAEIDQCKTFMTLTSTLEKSVERFERKILRTITGAICDQSTDTWRRKTNKELLTETGQSISHDIGGSASEDHCAGGGGAGPVVVTADNRPPAPTHLPLDNIEMATLYSALPPSSPPDWSLAHFALPPRSSCSFLEGQIVAVRTIATLFSNPTIVPQINRPPPTDQPIADWLLINLPTGIGNLRAIAPPWLTHQDIPPSDRFAGGQAWLPVDKCKQLFSLGSNRDKKHSEFTAKEK
ncbi:unnamed protein product [Nezara viridula]|uniref:Uncharacterized protein n=1 Tax=Nezara viridula TaxID=85310 RepID=A0A9P0HCM3_NEZVI|nr:unnamed protein product [Nezara viridula]